MVVVSIKHSVIVAVIAAASFLGSSVVDGQTEDCPAGFEYCAAYDDCIRPARETCPEPEPIAGGDVDEFGCIPSAGEEWCAELRECIQPFETVCPDYSTPPPVEVPLPGSDRDEHGCIPSAGFSWCEPKKECVREWETACPTSPSDCKTLAEIVCGSPDLSELCALVKKAKLDKALSSGSWTVFAPRNGGFDDIKNFEDFSFDRLRRLLKFHVVADEELYASDLKCTSPDNLITMANGFDSRTLCKEDAPTYQKGRKNSDKNKPAIVNADNKACNGVAHILSEAMLYKDY